MADVPVYRGKFGEREAARLLWRAGFGPKPGEAAKLARRFNLNGAVHALTRPKGKQRLGGPAPVDGDGLPLAPFDAYGHDQLWWLDRMVRTNQPLRERMALIWHDWFATADVNSQRFSIEQAQLFERRWMGPFDKLLLDVTVNPAMLVWLSGIDNQRRAPNENYARELMELFTLGASDAKGFPYSEDDVREQARALTGWTADYQDDVGLVNFRLDPKRHDTTPKTIFGQTGAFDWTDSCRLCVKHSAHKTFFIEKLWSYFIPVPPSPKTRKALEQLYVKRGYAVRPVVEAILMHPAFYRGPVMVKPPIVYIAGLLRARRRGIESDWSWMADMAGQRLFRPPNVSGWNDARWLDTSTFRGRWTAANEVAGYDAIDDEASYNATETPKAAVRKAVKFWGNPPLSRQTIKTLERYAGAVGAAATADWQQDTFRLLRQNALRMLVATCPEMQAS
ncbi:MAG TPA: DUF1800 family protein [Solirubrobacterales bacterium]|nr:DUF1800 family protein [Solirubrobacterales bacterium]